MKELLMNAKGITVSVIGAWLMSTTLATQENPAEPDFDTLDMIEVGDRNYPSWFGTFWSDGSAQLKILSIGSDGIFGTADAPAGSFSLKEICDLVKPRLNLQRGAEAVQVNLYFGYSDTTGKKFYVKDREVLRTLMHGLRDKVCPIDRSAFEDLLKRHPLVPGDAPAPVAYYAGMDEKTYMAARRAALDLPAPTNGGGWVIVTHLERPRPNETVSPKKSDTAEKETPVEPATKQTQVVEENNLENAPPPPSSRPWLYVGALALLCAVGTVFWRIRRKR